MSSNVCGILPRFGSNSVFPPSLVTCSIEPSLPAIRNVANSIASKSPNGVVAW